MLPTHGSWMFGIVVMGCSNTSSEPSTCEAGFIRGENGVCYLAEASSPDEDDGPTDDADGPGSSAGEWIAPPENCTAVDDLPPDPLVRVAQSPVTGFAHVVDTIYNPETDRYYVAGMPALTEWKVTDAVLTETLRYELGATEHVALMGPDRVAISRRGDATMGGRVEIFAVDEFEELATIEVANAAGMMMVDEYLYVLSGSGALSTFDVSDVSSPIQVHHLDGLGNPWDLAVQGAYAYVADNSQGLVTLSLSDPAAPTVLSTTMGVGGLQDLVVFDGHVYGAAGSRGVEIFSLAEPSAPASIGVVEPGGGIISVAVANGVLWTANQGGVAAIDVTDPTVPVVIGTQETSSWAMGVTASDAGAFLAGWNEVSLFTADPSMSAPDAQPDLSALYFPDGTAEQILSLKNSGAAALNIEGVTSDLDAIEIHVDSLTVEPGDTAQIRVRWLGEGDVEGDLCIATNDPDQTIQRIQILTSNDDSSVLIGELAPDFSLYGVDGDFYTLSEQLGSPVLLVYFATW
jgi:hypothetical protein